MIFNYKDKEYNFVYNGFGPLYTFESIAQRTFNPQLVSDMHLLLFSTALHCNPGTFKASLEEFFQFLYDNPEVEQKLVAEVTDAWKQRAVLAGEQKKSE